MLWQIQSFPSCTHHVFLSHCREDREWLVFPLEEELRRRGVIPWLDRHEYPYGRTWLQQDSRACTAGNAAGGPRTDYRSAPGLDAFGVDFREQAPNV